MKVYKDNEHSVTLSPFQWQGKRYLMVRVGIFAKFDPETGHTSLDTEQNFWKSVPDVFAALGQPPVLDQSLPKMGAEVLVAGMCRAPYTAEDKAKNKPPTPVQAQEVGFRVGTVSRRFVVFGDRQWLSPSQGGDCTEPLPFTAIPLTWEHSLGGPAFPHNPLGKGLDAQNKATPFLPNIEDPQHLITSQHSITDRPIPLCPFSIAIDTPARQQLSGTYDQHWLDTRWPAYPDDCKTAFFHSAQSAQHLHDTLGQQAFFTGNEDIEMLGMHADFPHIRGHFPAIRLRAFVLTPKEFCPFADGPATTTAQNTHGTTQTPQTTSQVDISKSVLYQPPRQTPLLPYDKDFHLPPQETCFHEVTLHCDTVWLLPDLIGAHIIFRALLPVVDDEMDDILRVFVVSEKPTDAPQSLEYYYAELLKRAYPSVDIDVAPFIEAQAKTTKAIKIARDMPKFFAKIKKNFLKESPVMPLNLDDMAFTGKKSIATARATLNDTEKNVLAQREKFSHLMGFDLSIFSRLRTTLDNQEQLLDKQLREATIQIKEATEQTKQEMTKLKEGGSNILGKQPPNLPPAAVAMQKKGQDKINTALQDIDKINLEEILFTPPPINPWHDRGFNLTIHAKRCLTRHDTLLARLATWGLDTTTINDAWLGYNASPLKELPQQWGLTPDVLPHNQENFTLPAGLYVPRFDKQTLIALSIYPLPSIAHNHLEEHTKEHFDAHFEGLGHTAPEAQHFFSVPESDISPLFLPAARDITEEGGAIVVMPESLSALFAEQEVGDFCHIVVAQEPTALDAISDLPPYIPQDVPPQDNNHNDHTATKAEIVLVIVLPPLPQGRELFTPWAEAVPSARPLYLPEHCQHVLQLTEAGHRLRRLILDIMPPAVIKIHDFDTPIPATSGLPQAFTLNMPLPSKEELEKQIYKLMDEIRAHFPNPEAVIPQMQNQCKELITKRLHEIKAPPEFLAKAEEAFNKPIDIKNPHTYTLAEIKKTVAERTQSIKDTFPKEASAKQKKDFLQNIAKAEQDTAAFFAQVASLETLEAEGNAKLDAFQKGQLPEDIQQAFADQGVDPEKLKPLTRQDVEVILRGDKNFERRIMQNLDLSELDFTGAHLAHAVCSGSNFHNAILDKANLTFTLANEADFSNARLHEATLVNTVLQKALLQHTDFTGARIKLCIFTDVHCIDVTFHAAHLELCTLLKSTLNNCSFQQCQLNLCSFVESTLTDIDFTGARTFKCLFQKSQLTGCFFNEAVLQNCLFQTVEAAHTSFINAEMRSFCTNTETNLRHANFTGADMREASLHSSYFCGAEFYKATIENAFFSHCNLSQARLDGLRAIGCRFIKCDLTDADLSGSNMLYGTLRKCRINGADLTHSNFFAAQVDTLVMDAHTNIAHANFKKTRLAGKEEAVQDVTRRSS